MFDLRAVDPSSIRSLFERFHGYASSGDLSTYAFAVFEHGKPIAGYLWNPPPPGASVSVCPELPCGVLSLSRMVAVPRDQRALKHVSKPLRVQMKRLIDRTRWPVLVTYSDEGEGHSGYVYQCSGWTATQRARVPTFTVGDRRVSKYQRGKSRIPEGAKRGSTWIQRWEHRYRDVWFDDDIVSLFAAFWDRVRVSDRTWRSGRPMYRYERR